MCRCCQVLISPLKFINRQYSSILRKIRFDILIYIITQGTKNSNSKLNYGKQSFQVIQFALEVGCFYIFILFINIFIKLQVLDIGVMWWSSKALPRGSSPDNSIHFYLRFYIISKGVSWGWKRFQHCHCDLGVGFPFNWFFFYKF